MQADLNTTAPPARARVPRVLADRAGYLLARAHFTARDIANSRLAPLGLEIKHFAALRVLADLGPMSQQALAEYVSCDRTTMVALVDALESPGYVERRRNPEDRRAYALQITAAGRQVLAGADDAIRAAEREVFAPLSASEERELKALLLRLLDAE
jgi:MarR family transcriptional regulator, lower aerobic nicotinate degradation pathway regulator